MKCFHVVIFVLVSAVTHLSLAQSADFEIPDYSPCKFGPGTGVIFAVQCSDGNPSEMLEAFRRNINNSYVYELWFAGVDDMSDDILEEIVDVVTSAASNNILQIILAGLPKVEKIPTAIRQFVNLRALDITQTGIKILPAGSMVLSQSVTDVNCDWNPNLEVIEPGFLRGNFSDGTITFYHNNLTELDEAVFRPLVSDSATIIYFSSNSISCTSCSLAWFVRDNRQYLDQIRGDCNDISGNSIQFEDVDAATLQHC